MLISRGEVPKRRVGVAYLPVRGGASFFVWNLVYLPSPVGHTFLSNTDMYLLSPYALRGARPQADDDYESENIWHQRGILCVYR